MSHFDVKFLDKNSERYMLSNRVRQLLDALKGGFFVEASVPTGDFFIREGQYSFDERNEGEWAPFSANADYWGCPEGYYWFKQTVTIPESFAGRRVEYRVKPYAGRWAHTNPQLIIWVNGKLLQGMDSNHQSVTVCDCAKGCEVLEIYINAHTDSHTWNGKVQFGAFLDAMDDAAVKIYYDIATPLEVASLYGGDESPRVNIVKELNAACNILDIDSGDRENFHKTARMASAYLDKTVYGKFGEPTAWSIGHTHIDVAWLWRLRQTREKAGRSFATVLKLMEEYPEYKFMSSQAQLYDFVKQDYPEVFEGIKQRIKEGRWEAEGSMWVEADTNVASGEALVRQFLVGKRFFKDEFGIDNKIMWLPDVFGYSAALPQIIKKSGLDYFMTTKISWNEYNKFPFDTFKWRGIDGTEVLSHFSPSRGTTDDERETFQTTYNAYLSPEDIIGGYRRYSQKDLGKDYLCTFGHGDGGGGPERAMLEHGRRMAKGIEGCPVVKIAPSLEFFRHLEEQTKDNNKLPVWCGELYLEFHRGTLTSQARNKKYNRKSECLYMDVETLCAIAQKKAKFAYPSERLLENWKLILLNQFHDILPGSSIREVYEDSKAQYESVLKAGCEMASDAEAALIAGMDVKEDSFVVFNTTGFERKDAVIADAPFDGDFAIFDKDGREIPYQKTYDGKIVFVASLPAKGYASFAVKKQQPAVAAAVAADMTGAETPFFNIEFDEKGNISRLIHKETHRSVAPDGAPVGKVIAYQDRPHNHEAWDIKCYFEEKSWELDFVNAELIECGAVRAVYKVERRFRNSSFFEYYIVYNALERIDVEYKTDWKENHVVLKADYPVDVNAVKATFDIQFGNVERSATRNTTWDFAQFEESMHKWCDLSDNGFGLSIINDCKYGCDIKDGHIRPTLLRCATSPNTVQDREYHEFTFSIYPHKGSVAGSGVVKEAYNINFPACAVFTPAHKGELKSEYSFVSADAENIVIETVKKAEDSDSVIIRAYETFNTKTPCTLTFGDNIKAISECDMTEANDTALAFDGCKAQTVFKPFEIKTFKVDF